MKKIMIIFYCLYVLVLSGCNRTTALQGAEQIQWQDQVFAKMVARALKKPLGQITTQDLDAIITIELVHEEGQNSALLLHTTEATYQCEYYNKITLTDLSDLIHFQNVTKLLLFCEDIDGLEICNQMPQLVELGLQSNTSQELLEKVSQLQYIKRLQIMFLNLDYSVLETMTGLETVKITNTRSFTYTPPQHNSALQTLPSEGIRIDLGGFYGTGNYELAATHPNICEMGLVIVPKGGEIGFLEQMTHLEQLKITGITDLTSISRMTWLKELIILDAPNVVDFTSLSNLTQLETFYLKTDVPQDFSINQIGAMKKLKKFTLLGNQISSLDGIGRFENLQAFTCDGLVKDISAINALSNSIQSLDLKSNNIADISSIQYLTKLTDLNLSHNKIADISPLQACVKLKVLNLNNNFILDITPLRGLPMLEDLSLYPRPDCVDQINLEQWHSTLLSLPALKLYCGFEDGEWRSENLPNVRLKSTY